MSTPTVVSLLRDNPAFRLLWGGTVVSFLGDWLTSIAVLTIVDSFSEAAIWVSAVLVAKTLPIFLVAPIAGPLADRFDRRRIMIATDLLRVVLVFAMLGAFWADSLYGVMLFLTVRTFVAGCFIPARSAALPDTVTDERYLPVAMAAMGGTWSVMLALGAALGGVLTEVVGVTGALLVDAATFLLSAAILWGLPALPPRKRGEDGGAGFMAGLQYLRGRVYLTSVLLLKPSLFISGAILVLLPLFAGGYYPGWDGPLYLGALYTARGLGALIGSLGVRRVIGDAVPTLQRAILAGYLLVTVANTGLAFSPSFPVTFAMIMLAMMGTGMIWPFAGTLGQLATERHVRGRLFAMEFGLTMLSSSAAAVIVGLAVDSGVTPRQVLLTLAAVALVPCALWALVLRFAPDVPDGAPA